MNETKTGATGSRWRTWCWLPIPLAPLAFALPAAWLWWEAIWSWLGHDGMYETTGALRNISLSLAGFLGILFLLLAFWRSHNAHRQAETSIRQAEIQIRQADAQAQQALTSERGVMSDRYQKGVEMLNSSKDIVRMGGVLALDRLAREHPGEYHVQVMDLLCGFIRSFEFVGRPVSEGSKGVPRERGRMALVPQDVRRAARAVGECRRELNRKSGLGIEAGFSLDLAHADLPAMDLKGANFTGVILARANLADVILASANLVDADLAGADLAGANLAGADLAGANLAGANLENGVLLGANLKGANLSNVNLSDADLSAADLRGADLESAGLVGVDLAGATGLTQGSLRAVKPSKPPASLPSGLFWPFKPGEDGERLAELD